MRAKKNNSSDVINEIFLTPTIMWFNNTYILQTIKEGLDWHYIGGIKKKYVNKNEKQLLKYLGVFDKESADNKIQLLQSSSHKIQKSSLVYERLKDKFGDVGLAGWDFCCIIYIYAWCYLYDFYPFGDAMDMSLITAKRLQELFNSWESLILNFLYGYEHCFNEKPLDISANLFELYDIYERLLENKEGPLKLDWNIELKREW